MPEISVIVPVYNVEKYIPRCLDSLLGQTFDNIEILLVDDGSKDSSGDICDEYAARDERIKVFHKQNGGVSSARNTGLDNASGKYVMFCDPDDYAEPTWCEKLHEAIEESGGFFACCGYNQINISKNTSRIITINSEFDRPNNISLLSLYISNLTYPVWNKIYNKELIYYNNMRYDETISIGEDLIFVLNYLKIKINDISFIPNPLYNYHTDITGSLTKAKIIPKQWELSCRIYDEIKNTLDIYKFDFLKYYKIYYNRLIHSIEGSINMVFAYDISLSERFSRGREILRSPQCREAFKYGDFGETHPVYKAILKTHSFFLVWLFRYAVAFKHKIIK